MNSLVDTNVFLEILLNQQGTKKCQDFLDKDAGAAWISDFSLHSIGVLLFRRGRAELFRKFIKDTLAQLTVLTLSSAGYEEVVLTGHKFGLDFDDAYQFCVAKESGLTIATQDKDFERVKGEIAVTFI
jgi:predicted nucleic acid-binding protein